MLFSHINTNLKRLIKSDGFTIQGNSIRFFDITTKTLHELNSKTEYPDWYNSFVHYPVGLYAKVSLNNKNETIFFLGKNRNSYIKSILVTHDLLLRGIESPIIRHDNIVKSELSLNSFISYINNKFDYKFYIKYNHLYYNDEKLVEYKHYNQIAFFIYVAHQLLYYDSFQLSQQWLDSIKTSGYELTSKDGVFTRTKVVPTFNLSIHPVYRTLDHYSVDSQLIALFDETLSNL